MRQQSTIALLLLLCSACGAADYYVATTGNDTSGDGSIGSPWATITKAKTNTAAGDTVHVSAGYYAERPTITISGSAGNPITYTGPAVASGQMRTATNNGFVVQANYVTIQYFCCTNTATNSGTISFGTDSGITVGFGAGGKYVNVISNDVHDAAGPGLFVYDNPAGTLSDNLIQGNRCWSNTLSAFFLHLNSNGVVRWNEGWGTYEKHPKSPGQKGDADGLQIWGKNLTVESNHIWGLWFHTNDAYNNYAHVDALQTWYDSSGRAAFRDSSFRANVFDVPWASDGCMMLQGCSNNVFYNNVFRSYHIGNISTDTSANYHEQFFNNTFIAITNSEFAFVAGTAFGFFSINQTNSDQQDAFTNNLFLANGTCQAVYAYNGAGAVGGFNLWNTTAGTITTPSGYSYSTGDITNQNPLLVDPFTVGALTLSGVTFPANSPAKDAGAAIGAFSTDILGTHRPGGAAWDIGAYEYWPYTTNTLGTATMGKSSL